MGPVRKIRVGVLTSSRADFGIYLPLLKEMANLDNAFQVKIITFGTHLSKFHGYTKDDILSAGFRVSYEIPGLLLTDDSESISTAFGVVVQKFSSFWAANLTEFDYVLCLGDRYEMAAAVLAGVPFNIPFVHIHAGETTLGAIDNVFRHSITLASIIHLVAAEKFKERVAEIVGDNGSSCFVVGALSLSNIGSIKMPTVSEFKSIWGIDLTAPYVLVTVHPETVSFQRNNEYSKTLFDILSELVEYRQIIITMPNADTNGTLFRESYANLKRMHEDKVHLVENLGSASYFTCMSHADFLLGNTSSGIIEAASFKKYVINIGDRQKGRLCGENVINVAFNKELVLKAAYSISGKTYDGANIYFQSNSPSKIIEILKTHFDATV